MKLSKITLKVRFSYMPIGIAPSVSFYYFIAPNLFCLLHYILLRLLDATEDHKIAARR